MLEVVEAIGAMQGQAWGALPVGLWSRMESFALEDLYAALERGDLRWGIGVRGTLHLVSAREHPAYAVVASEGWTGSWHRAIQETTPPIHELRGALLDFAAPAPRTNEEIREFVEAWVAERPDAIEARELEAQRSLKWRPIYRWSALTRVPKDGGWGAKAPADHLAAPILAGRARSPSVDEAVERVTRRHLRAFGPAAAEDWPVGSVGARRVDGLVAGTWSVDVRRREATLTLRPAAKLTRPARTALTTEGTGLLKALHSEANAHHVTVDG